MANRKRSIFSPGNSAANVVRFVGIFAVLVLVLVTIRSGRAYLEDQRMLQAMEVGALDSQRLAELQKVLTPFWLVITQATGAGMAIFGTICAFLLGNSRRGEVLALSLICVGIAEAWLPWELITNLSEIRVSKVGEEPSPAAYFGQVFLIGLLVLSPPLALWFYYRSPILDRYVVKQIVPPLSLCFFGFLGAWIVHDLTDNGEKFIEAGSGLDVLLTYYLVQLPQMVVLVLPVTLLLAVLFALGKMSRSNEIVSMLGSGLSLSRILTPVLIIGLYASLVCGVLKYEWAPMAEERKEAILDAVDEIGDARREGLLQEGESPAKLRKSDEWAARAWMYRNDIERRTWFVGRIPLDLANSPMRSVAVWWQNKDGDLLRGYRAKSVTWNHKTRSWTFHDCRIWDYDEYGIAEIEEVEEHVIEGWRETPWHVVSSSLKPEYLGIPRLTNYLKTNRGLPDKRLSPYRTFWHYSWAEPVRCFLIVLMAAPLGIVHSRRGVLGGVAAAMMIFFCLIFFDGVFLMLGQTHRIWSWLGAWGPNLLIAAVGGLLFYARARNKELPSPHKLVTALILKYRSSKHGHS